MKKLLVLGLAFVFVVTSLVGCAKREDKIVAKVGDRKITLGELEESFFTQMRMASASGRDISERKAILEDMVRRELLIVYAYKQGLDKDEKIDSLLREREKSFLMEELYNVEIIKKSKPSKSEVKSFYNKLKEKLRARHILVKTKEEADSIYDRLKGGEDFEKLAKQRSIDKFTAPKGGDLGFFSWGSMVEPFQKTVFNLKPKELSKPIKTRFGWHIIKLEEKQEVELPDFESSREVYAQQLERMEQGESITRYFEKLKEKENLEVDSLTFHILLTKASKLDAVLGERRVTERIVVDEFTPLERQAILVKYRSGQMSLEAFATGFATLPPNLRSYGFSDEEGLKEFVFQMLLPDMLVQAAYRKGIDRRESFKKRVLDLKETQIALKIREEFILDTVEATPEEIEEFYQKNKDIYIFSARVHIKEIMLGSKEEAEEILNKIKSGVDFSKTAQEKTLRVDAKRRGGDLGYIQKSQHAELFEAGFKLRKGEIGGPVKFFDPRLGEVYSIIKLIDKRKEELKSFAEVKEDAKIKVLWEKRNEAMNNWTEKAKEEIKVEIYEKVLGVTGEDTAQTEG